MSNSCLSLVIVDSNPSKLHVLHIFKNPPIQIRAQKKDLPFTFLSTRFRHHCLARRPLRSRKPRIDLLTGRNRTFLVLWPKTTPLNGRIPLLSPRNSRLFRITTTEQVSNCIPEQSEQELSGNLHCPQSQPFSEKNHMFIHAIFAMTKRCTFIDDSSFFIEDRCQFLVGKT